MSRLSKLPTTPNKNRKEDPKILQKFLEWFGFSGFIHDYVSNFINIGRGILNLIGISINILTQIIPPLQAATNGIFSILKLVEASTLSDEVRSLKQLKAFNGITSISLGIASLILALNPGTVLIGSILSLIAISVSVTENSYGLFLISKDLAQAQKDLREFEKLKSPSPSYEQRKTYEELQERVEKLTASYTRQKSSLMLNLASLFSTACLVVGAISAVASVLTPVGFIVLAAIGLTVLGVATFKSIKDVFLQKPAPVNLASPSITPSHNSEVDINAKLHFLDSPSPDKNLKKENRITPSGTASRFEKVFDRKKEIEKNQDSSDSDSEKPHGPSK